MTVSMSRNLCLYSSAPSTTHPLAPLISMSTNFLGSPFTLSKQPLFMPSKSSASALSTCVRTETPSQTNPDIADNVFDEIARFCRPDFPGLVSRLSVSEKKSKPRSVNPDGKAAAFWPRMKDEAMADVDREPILSNYYFGSILSHDSMESALANYLSVKLGNSSLPTNTLYNLFMGVLKEDEEIMAAVKDDLRAVKERDPACISYVHCFLNFKGFLAIQSHRIAHNLWSKGRKILALLIQNRVSEVFAVDIHPGARIGRGILLDHATGVVIGETAVIGDNVSILHNVTLGGTGKVSGDRHPKIGDGVLIGAGTCVLGNVRIEDGAKIGAGSVVLKEVPARTTAVGNPARLIGGRENPVMLDKMPSLTMDQTSHISEWSDYVI